MVLDELGQEFRARNLYTQVYSVKYRDFIDFKSYVVGGGIWFPNIENENPHAVDMGDYPGFFTGSPAHHLFFQCRRAVDRGIVVEKGPKVTDDLLRAAVLATHWLLDEKWASKFMAGVASSDGRPIGGYLGRSTGMGAMAGTPRAVSPIRPGGEGGEGKRVMVIGRSSRSNFKF